MAIIRSQDVLESVGKMLARQVEVSSMQDVTFLCDDGRTGFTRSLLALSPLMAELLPPPGNSCCEKLLTADQAKVHLTLDGVKVRDLQQVLGFLLGVHQDLGPESLEVAAMLGFAIKKINRKELSRVSTSKTVDQLINGLLEETIERTVADILEEISTEDDLEEDTEYVFAGDDLLEDEISLYPSTEEVPNKIVPGDKEQPEDGCERSSQVFAGLDNDAVDVIDDPSVQSDVAQSSIARADAISATGRHDAVEDEAEVRDDPMELEEGVGAVAPDPVVTGISPILQQQQPCEAFVDPKPIVNQIEKSESPSDPPAAQDDSVDIEIGPQCDTSIPKTTVKSMEAIQEIRQEIPAPSVLESIEELNEIMEDPQMIPGPSVLDSIEELDSIIDNDFENTTVDTEEEDVDKLENPNDQIVPTDDDDDEIVFNNEVRGKRREEIFDEDTMPEFEAKKEKSVPKLARKKIDIASKENPTAGEYDANDVFNYEEDEDYDEEIIKLQNQIDSMITDNAAKEEGLKSSGRKKRAREESDDKEEVRGKRSKIDEMSCHLCQKSLKGANDYLQHLSRSHYGKELFSKFPLSDGENCQLCVEENKEKVFVFKKAQKSNYTLHVGKNHLRVLQFVPEDIQETLTRCLRDKVELGKVETETDEKNQTTTEPSVSLDESISASTDEDETEPETKQAEESNASGLELEENCPQEGEGNVKTKRRKSVSFVSASCSFCGDDAEYPRWKLMNHLTRHFAKEISEVYINENFVPNEKCSLCIQENRDHPLVITSKTAYIRHVGSAHDKVLDFIPEEHAEKYRILVRQEKSDKPEEKAQEVFAADEEAEQSKAEENVVELNGKKKRKKSVGKESKKKNENPEEKVQEVSAAAEEAEQSKVEENEENAVELKGKKIRKKSVGKESTKMRKTPTESKEEKTDPPQPVPKKKSYIPVMKDRKTAPGPKPLVIKTSSVPGLQCGECHAELTSKLELVKHMKSHIKK